MLPSKIKCRKNRRFFFVRGAKRRPLACEATALTIRLHASHGMEAVKTACNRDGGDTIARLVTPGHEAATVGGMADNNIGSGEGIANHSKVI